jgi:hypothetical protein
LERLAIADLRGDAFVLLGRVRRDQAVARVAEPPTSDPDTPASALTNAASTNDQGKPRARSRRRPIDGGRLDAPLLVTTCCH